MLDRLRAPALHSIAGGLLQKAIPFIASLYVARTVGQDDFATFAFFINTANTITALSALGLAPAILTTLSNRSDGIDTEDKITAIFAISAVICVIAVVLGLLSTRIHFNAISNRSDFSGVIVLAPALVLLQTVQSTYQGTNRHSAFSLQSAVLAVLVTITLLLASTVKTDSTLLGGAYSAAFFIVGSVSAVNLLSRQKVTLRSITYRARTVLRPIIKAQLPFAAYTALWMLAIYLCNLRIASAFTVSDLAFYNVGFQWYSLMLLVPATLGGVLIPHFAVASGSGTAQMKIIHLTLVFGAIALPVTLLMYLAAPWLLQLYEMPPLPQGLTTVRNLILSGGIAFTLTPALQQFMAVRRFRLLISISVCWSAIALCGTYLVANGSDDVSLSFLFAYCAIALLIIATILTLNTENFTGNP